MSYTSSLPALVLSTCIEHWPVLSVWYLLVDDTECSFVKIQQCIFFTRICCKNRQICIHVASAFQPFTV